METTPVRVCLITERWAPRFAGAALRFRQYLPGLRARGFETNVLCTTPPAESAADRQSWERLSEGDILPPARIDGSEVYRVKLPEGRTWHRNRLFRRAIRKHLSSSGAAVAQFLTLEPLRANPLAGLGRSPARTVFTGTQLHTQSRKALRRALQRAWIRYPVQTLDHLVVSSGVMQEFYRSLGVTTPISIIPNGVDLDRFDRVPGGQARRTARERLELPQDSALIVFVGSIIARKGVDRLIEAFPRVARSDSTARLVLVGPRDDSGTSAAQEYDRRVEGLVEAGGVRDRIHFTGFTDEVDAYLRAADVFVLPSRREGMGNVVLEAMAVGVPTVLTPYLGLPAEFGTAGREYVLSDPQPAALSSAILDLLENPERREAVGRSGREWVERHMDMKVIIDAYAQVYRDLAMSGRVRQAADVGIGTQSAGP